VWCVPESVWNRLLRGAFAALSAALLIWSFQSAASAQSQPQRPAAGAQSRTDDAKAERGTEQRRNLARRTGAPEDGPALDSPFHALPLRPTADDRSPLAEGEEDELLAFADEQIHPLYEALNRLRQGRPRAFRERLEQLAPHLRFLRRIHAQNPQMGRRLVEHVKNNQFLERVAREWRRRAAAPNGKPVDPAERRRLAQEARHRAGQNVRIEVGILEFQARQLEESRARRIGDRIAVLAAADEATLAGETEDVQSAARALRTAEDEASRASAERQLRDLLEAQVTREIGELRARADELRQNAPAEVNRRVRRIFGAPPDSAEPTGEPARP
jgi:two-component sensor histidine kinase